MTAGGAGRDPYAVLGLDPPATPAEVRAAYRRRLRQLHPDLHEVDDGSVHEAMAELAEAWAALSGPGRPPDLADLRSDRPGRPAEPWSGDAVMSARSRRRLSRLLACAAMLLSATLVVFTVIAFSQSG